MRGRDENKKREKMRERERKQKKPHQPSLPEVQMILVLLVTQPGAHKLHAVEALRDSSTLPCASPYLIHDSETLRGRVQLTVKVKHESGAFRERKLCEGEKKKHTHTGVRG